MVHPRNKEDVVKIVEYCNSQRIPIITWGAGSGVVFGSRASKGGVCVGPEDSHEQGPGGQRVEPDRRGPAGMMGPDYEEALNDAPRRFGTKRSYTCGHFPQSFELSSVGGWILASGSGQASTYYGDACDLVISAEYVTPAGLIRTHDIPGTATGPRVNDMMKGSEGDVRGPGRSHDEDLPAHAREPPAFLLHVQVTGMRPSRPAGRSCRESSGCRRCSGSLTPRKQKSALSSKASTTRYWTDS